MIKHQPLMLNN